MYNNSVKESQKKYNEKNKVIGLRMDNETYNIINKYIEEHEFTYKEFFKEAALYYIDNH